MKIFLFALLFASSLLAKETAVFPVWVADLCRVTNELVGKNCKVSFSPYNNDVRNACSIDAGADKGHVYGVIWNGQSPWTAKFNDDGTEAFIFRKVPTYQKQCFAELTFLFDQQARLIHLQAGRQGSGCEDSLWLECEF
jgi:hypothetical protein